MCEGAVVVYCGGGEKQSVYILCTRVKLKCSCKQIMTFNGLLSAIVKRSS